MAAVPPEMKRSLSNTLAGKFLLSSQMECFFVFFIVPHGPVKVELARTVSVTPLHQKGGKRDLGYLVGHLLRSYLQTE